MSTEAPGPDLSTTSEPAPLTLGVEGIEPPRHPETTRGQEQKNNTRLIMGFLDNFEDVGIFHEKFGLHQAIGMPGPQEVPEELLKFRLTFLLEELLELAEGVGYTLIAGVNPGTELVFDFQRRSDNPEPVDHAKAFDALIDIVYVAMGTAHLFGYPWQAGWMRVQNANLAKVRATQETASARGGTFDVIKPPGWTPPDIEGLLRDYGWDAQ